MRAELAQANQEREALAQKLGSSETRLKQLEREHHAATAYAERLNAELAAKTHSFAEQSKVHGESEARLRLEHASGVRTEIDSDLTSPVRERSITLHFDQAVLVGHYPCSDADHTAQLRTVRPGEEATRTVCTDDAFPAFLRGAYVRYARPATSMHRTLPVQVDAVRLLTEAKRLCAESGGLREGARDAGAIR